MAKILAFYLLVSLVFPAIHVFVLPALLAAKLFYVSPSLLSLLLSSLELNDTKVYEP